MGLKLGLSQEEHRMWVFGKRVLRRILGHKGVEKTTQQGASTVILVTNL
jgi:hypothetical protein